MENNISNKKEKKPRSLIIAENKRASEIKHVLELRDEMIANKIDNKLIKKYLDEQYNKINQSYEEKVKKYQEKELKKQNKQTKEVLKVKREKAIEVLLKNKAYLEDHGYKHEYIKKYVDKQYNEINQNYSIDPEDKIYNVDLDKVNFID